MIESNINFYRRQLRKPFGIREVLIFLILFSISSCDFLLNSENNSGKTSLLILKVDQEKNFSFQEVPDYGNYSQAYDDGFEPYSDDSFISFYKLEPNKGLIISYENGTYEIRKPSTFRFKTNDLKEFQTISYRWKKRITTDNNYSLDYQGKFGLKSTTEIIEVNWEYGKIQKKKVCYLPNEIIGDSIFISYSYLTDYQKNNLFQVEKSEYKINLNPETQSFYLRRL